MDLSPPSGVPAAEPAATPVPSDLLATIERARQESDRFTAAVIRGGFSMEAPDLSGLLFALFNSASRAMRGSPDEVLPWFLIRSLALDIAGENGNATAGRKMVEGLLAADPPDSVRDRLETDLAQMIRASEIENLQALLEANKLSEARAAADALLRSAADSEDARQLRDVRDAIQQDISDVSRRRRIGLFIVPVLIVSSLALSFLFGGSDPVAPRPERPIVPALSSPAGPAQSGSVQSGARLKIDLPPSGEGHLLSQPQLRWCRFEFKSLEATSALIDASDEWLNATYREAVADYASRCTNFRYGESDLAQVESELRLLDAASTARSKIARWSSRRPGAGQPAPAVPEHAHPTGSSPAHQHPAELPAQRSSDPFKDIFGAKAKPQ